MKTTMKKTAAYLLALLLVLQMVPAAADTITSNELDIDSELLAELRIINESGKTILKDMTLPLYLPYGYDSATWSSSDESIATVDENGVVTGIEVGKVTITAESNGARSSIEITVVAPAQASTGSDKTAMTILVSGNKIKTPYDGQVHKIEYTFSSDNSSFVPGKVSINAEVPSRKDAGATKGTLTEKDFSYNDDAVEATFIVNDGSIWITPIIATVKADDVTVSLDKIKDMELTATVDGLLEGDTIAYSFPADYNEITEAGEYNIVPEGNKSQGGYSVKFEAGTLTIQANDMPEYPLYNIAKIGNTYYRLAKTKVWTEYKLENPNFGKVLKTDEYIADPYDFTELTITIDNTDYVYKCQENAEAILKGANYYEIKSEKVTIIKEKIGAMDGNTPRWIVPEDQRYNDPNKTNSIHRDYEITLHKGEAVVTEQRAYNFVGVDGSNDYYKLPTTSITAKPLEKYSLGTVAEGEYILERYDFTDLVLTIDGVEYKYNDGSLDEYENYYTVSFADVQKNDHFNRNETWFKNRDSWLAGAYEEYGDQPNKTIAYHANYLAVTHKAAQRRSITISSDWPSDKLGYIGAKITLTAHLSGFDGLTEGTDYQIQWQYSTDKKTWHDVAGANGTVFTFILNEKTTHYTWRVTVTDLK